MELADVSPALVAQVESGRYANLNPAMRERWVDWGSNARNILAGLWMRMSQDPAFCDEIARLVEVLCDRDEQFHDGGKRWIHRRCRTR